MHVKNNRFVKKQMSNKIVRGASYISNVRIRNSNLSGYVHKARDAVAD